MKKLILLLFVAFSFNSLSQESNVEWHTDMNKAIEVSMKSKKPMLLFFTGSDWCGWCKRMDLSTFKDPIIINYLNSKFYAVKFNGESKDTITFNNHTFYNSDPLYVKKTEKSRGKAHWFAHSILDGKLSYPSYVVLDENLVRLMVYNGYKKVDEMLGILLFFGANQYKYYHNHLNEQWVKSK